MATTEYYRKQVELLLVWAMATTNPDLKAKLLARALVLACHGPQPCSVQDAALR